MDRCYECDLRAEIGLCKRRYVLNAGGPTGYRAEAQALRSQLKDAEEVIKDYLKIRCVASCPTCPDGDITYAKALAYRSKYGMEESTNTSQDK